MAGELKSVVIRPRFTTFVGETVHATLALDPTAYRQVSLGLRGGVSGNCTFTVSYEGAADQPPSTGRDGGGGVDPGPSAKDGESP